MRPAQYRKDLIKCMKQIINDETIKHMPTIQQASGLKRTLNDKKFIFWLTFFHKIMSHVDIFYNQLQKRGTDNITIKANIDSFTNTISNIRNEIDKIGM